MQQMGGTAVEPDDAAAPEAFKAPDDVAAVVSPDDLLARLAEARIALATELPPDSPAQAALRAAVVGALARADAPVVQDPRSRALFAEATHVAGRGTTVLITGPSGAGKDVLARHIHALSPRAGQAFVAVNCAALPETMLEALLFGHERGAFTGAASASPGLFRAADGGTLFLDEVGELPLTLQAKLLRAVQEREVLPLGGTRVVPVDVRLVAATNRDLPRAVAEGRFREDLFWRLSVFPLAALPLVERRGDLPALAAALLLRIAREEAAPLAWLSDMALARLLAHNWPGNVRELGNVLQRAAILAARRLIAPGDLRLGTAMAEPAGPGAQPAPARGAEGGLFGQLRSHEAEAIRAALQLCGGRRALAAQRLGISERTLRYKLAELAGRPRTGGRAGRGPLREALQ
jgi:two-component system response regulator FlrC